jgi:hypothetical protein
MLGTAKKHMTPEGYALLVSLLAELPDCMDRPTSSSGKYHQRDDGSVPTIRQHTKEMLVHGLKKMRMSDYSADELCFAVILHDALKYGWENGKHTITGPRCKKDHGQIVAEFWADRAKGSPFNVLRVDHALLYHSGRWSAATPCPLGWYFFDSTFMQLTYDVHDLDMLSANNCLKEVE